MPIQPNRTRRAPGAAAARAGRADDDETTVVRSDADAALLVARVSGELVELSHTVQGLQAALAATLAATAERDPTVMLQAQKLDLVTQWLQDLALFLSGLRLRRLGREPLDFEALIAPLALAGLGARLAGRVTVEENHCFELL